MAGLNRGARAPSPARDRDTLIATLVEHAKHPRHAGRLQPADAVVPAGNPGCGDVITLFVKADPESERVVEASFEGAGCTISQGAASLLLREVNRNRPTFDDVAEFSYDAMLDLAGREVVGFRHACATLALGALKAAVKMIQMDRKLRAAGHSEADIQRLRQALGQSARGGFVLDGDGESGRGATDEDPTPAP